MAVYNIQTKLGYNIPRADWTTGNDRNNIEVRPLFGIIDDNYTVCIFDLSFSGNTTSLTDCRLPTEAWHGSQPSVDIMINNIIVEK
jgi:hypothetical protein